MILRFKAGSEAEAVVKSLVENVKTSHEHAKNIVEEITGVRPAGFGYNWVFGMTYMWSCRIIGFEEVSPEKIDGLTFTQEHNGIRYFRANRGVKKGKAIVERFQNDQKILRTDGEVLHKFGIYTKKGNVYSDFGLGEDEKGVWMTINNSTFERLEPHPDVFLESEIKTVSAN